MTEAGGKMTIDEKILEAMILNNKLEYQRRQIQKARTKLFNILTEYEIGTYDKNMHEFYNKVYDVHNELIELEHEKL